MAERIIVRTPADLAASSGNQDLDENLTNALKIGWEIISVGYDSAGVPQNIVFKDTNA
jgi:hypothetical protein